MIRLFESRASRLAFVVLPALMAVACRDSTGLRPRQPVSLSLTATRTPVVPRTSSSPSFSISPVGASAAVAPAAATVVTGLQLVLSHIELEQASASCVGTPTGSEGECEDLQLDPTVVDIPVDAAGVKTIAIGSIPAGSYNAFHATVDVIRAGDDRAAAFFAVPANKAFDGVSVKVTGKDANGATFTYASTVKGEIETTFQPALVVGTPNQNVSVEIDVSNWFNGVVNPASPTAAERTLIDSRIRQSMRAFEDDNKDGKPDTH
jgi:hypothetical protein